MAVLWPFMNKDERARSKEKSAKLKAYLLIVLLYFLMGQLQAQEPIKPLKVGDKVPEIKLKSLYNTKRNNLRLTVKNKLTILDFWSTWCGPCIQSLPALHQVQKKYNKELTIYLLNADAKPKLTEFVSTYQKNNEFSLPMLKYTIYVKSLFAHYSIPHLVWLNADGVIIAITDKEALNDNNIVLALSGKILPIAQKNLHKPQPRKVKALIQSKL